MGGRDRNSGCEAVIGGTWTIELSDDQDSLLLMVATNRPSKYTSQVMSAPDRIVDPTPSDSVP